MELKDTTLARFQFFGEMERGRKFEKGVQEEIEKTTFGDTFNNVRIDHMEFDAIIADYPLMTFVEIKAYRSNFSREEIKKALIKLVKNCVTITEDKTLCYRDWVPHKEKWETAGNRKWLLKKLGIGILEGWQFRMVFVIPDKSFIPVMSAIKGKRLSSNLLDVGGFPLLVIPKRRVKELF